LESLHPPLPFPFPSPACWFYSGTVHLLHSCPIIIENIITLDIESTYEQQHMTFGFLSMAYFPQYHISISIHFPANDIIPFFFMVQ
jgi:hypothetical protein